jgi:hypothetical protein
VPTLKSVPTSKAPLLEVDTLCVFISGFGLDHSDFFDAFIHLNSPRSVLVAITPPAFCSRIGNLCPNTLYDQASAILDCIDNELSESCYSQLNIFGFSVGADLITVILPELNKWRSLRNIYLADLNISRESCFITSHIANSPTPGDALKGVANTSNNAELADISSYFGKIIRKDRWSDFQILAKDVFDNADSRFETFSTFMETPRGFNLKLGFSSVNDVLLANKIINSSKISCDNKVSCHFDFIELSSLSKILHEFGCLEPMDLKQ